ncbi:MAG: tetratricopeptide repeat protein, partial [Deltaproteobacteria bacterium]
MVRVRFGHRQPLAWIGCAASAAAVVATLVLSGCRGNEEHDWQLEHTYQLGMEAMAKGQLEKAERAFRKLLEKNPGHLGARLKLARVLVRRYGNQKDPQLISQASELAESAVKDHPKDTGALEVLAEVQQAAGKRAAALRTRLKLADITPNDTANLLKAARLAVASGKEEMAEKLLERAGKLGSGQAKIELAEMFERRGDVARARKILESVES